MKLLLGADGVTSREEEAGVAVVDDADVRGVNEALEDADEDAAPVEVDADVNVDALCFCACASINRDDRVPLVVVDRDCVCIVCV